MFEDMWMEALDGSNCGVRGPRHSMALYLVVKHWRQQWRESGIFSEKVTGIVVDHGLRPESGAEALQVQHWIENLGRAFHNEDGTKQWDHWIGRNGIRFSFLFLVANKRQSNRIVVGEASAAVHEQDLYTV